MYAMRVRDDEHAEIELRILVALYEAWPDQRDIRPAEVYRPGARYTNLDDARPVIRRLLAGRVDGHLGATGLVDGKLTPAMRARLDDADARGTPWIERTRAVIAEASSPVTGHAREVRDQIRG